MSNFMPKSISGNLDSDGTTTSRTHLFSPAFSLTQVGENVGKLDPDALSSYTAINEPTAYLKFLTKLINEINVRAFIIDPNSPTHKYIIKYLMVTTFILISGFTEGIKCDVSYIRIDEDEYSPFRPDNTYKGAKFFKEILNSWAEYLDPDLIAHDSTTVAPIRMLRVVKINDIPVAYYTSMGDRIIFYPFNTIISNGDAVTALPGVSVNSKTHEWEFDYNTFRGMILNGFTDEQKNILAAAIQKYAVVPGDGNGFSLLLRELDLKVPIGATPLDGPNAIGILLPLKINKFSNPYNNMVKQDFPCKDKFNDLLKVPHKKMATNSSSDSIFHALGYTLPKCQVITRDGNTHLRISQVAETIKFFHTDNGNRTDIGPDGIAWSPNENGPINLDIEYVDQNGNIISLGTYAITEVEGGASVKLFTWDKTNLQLICTSIPPKTIKPFLDKYWDKVPEVIPVTREFIDLLEANNCHIADYIPTPEEVSFKIVDDNDTTIEFVSRSYSENERIAYAIEDGQDTIYTDMPQLSVFPNYTFTYSKNQVWNKYYFTAIGEGEDAYSYFKKIKLQYKRQGVEDYSNMEFVKKPLLNEDDKTFIAYRSFMTFIPDKIFLLDENGKQFGVILLPKPKKKTLDTDRTAIVGVDMGSRNSIVAYYRKGNDTRINFTYNRNDLIGNVCNDSRPQDQNEREQLLNLHGLSGEPVEKSFTSAVLDYMDCDAIDRTDPMVHGRVVADLSEGSFKKIMGLAKDVTEEPDDGDKLSLIGYHSNFKRNLWTPENEKIRKPCVKLFVRNICYRLLLNAFLNDCGKIELRFTAPNGTVGDRLKGYWIEALGLAKTEFGLPDNISNNISVDDYKLESVALYHHIQNDPDDLPYPYSIIIDGGDSTFDVSMIYKGPDDTTRLCQNFSIKYAGYDLLVKSITKVALKKNYNLDDFISMWVSDDADKKEELKEEIRKLAEVGVGNNNVDWENSKTVEDIVYKLVESSNYGLHKNSTAAKDAVSLVRLKYLLLLNAIIQTCIDSIPIGEISDETTTKNVSVFLYGGANNIAKLLYGDRKSIEKKLGSIMTNWLDRYENPAKVKRIELRYNVNPDKTELVSGLVQTTIDPDDENIKTNPFVPKKYTQATYDDIIKGIFSSEKDSGYWNDDDFILDFPDIVETKPELQGANEEEVMKSCKGAVLKKLGDEDIPNRAVYPLATMFYAVYKFESTFKPEKNK